MMKMKECKIVQDILPNYIEQLTSEETNQYVEEHLNSCEECKNIYENMKSEMN
ncbi:MAG: zf-HC2 domain-containing protein, partial [Clostridia bacterium]